MGAGGNKSWMRRPIGWAMLGLVGTVGMVACSATDITDESSLESASGSASAPEQIGQVRQGITNSPYVPSGYYCKTNDEFGGDFGGNQANANIDSTKWGFQNTNVNNEAQNYTTRQCIANPSDWNYCVKNGALTIQARNVALDCSNTGNAACADMILNGTESGAPSKSYTSGRLTSKTKSPFQKQYGYIEFKARLPFQGGSRQQGLWPALWFLGANINEGPGSAGGTAWPWAPEFDLMEWQSRDAHDIVLNGVSHPQPAGMMAPNAIYIGGDGNMDACNVWPETGSTDCYNGAGAQTWHKFDNAANPATGVFNVNDWSGSIIQGWHTYGLLWTSSSMTAYIDGANQGHVNLSPNATEFQANMFILMNLAVGGDLGGPIQVSDWTKATLDVDYVRWYQSGGSDTCTGTCTAETDTAFCSRLGKNCGSVTANDNCGTSRTVSSCGTCTSPATCGGGGTANVCGSGCTAETNTAFCSRLGKNCGSVTANDNCGTSRTVSSCGTCTSPATCGGGGTANVCGGGGGGTCKPAYAQANCGGYTSYTPATQVSQGGHNWTCLNDNCRNCATYASCAPGGSGCPWGTVWTDNGACQ